MPFSASSISVDTIALRSGSRLSILRHDRQPRVCWLSAMEVHAHVLCTNLHTLPRNVQLSRKASYRQDLAKLHLPYRIATRDELNALKHAGVLSMQAPSSMLMRVEDALKLLREKGHGQARKVVKRKWRRWMAGAVDAPKDNSKQGKENDAGAAAAETAGAAQVAGKPDSSSSDGKKGGRSQRKRSASADELGSEQPNGNDDADSSSGEEDDSDDSDDEGGSGNARSAARILSSHQFHLLWSTPSSPSTLPTLPPLPALTPSSTPTTSPTNSQASTPPLPASPSSTASPASSPLLTPLARLKKRPRKSSSPFSLSWSRWLGEAEASAEAGHDADSEAREQKRRRTQ